MSTRAKKTKTTKKTQKINNLKKAKYQNANQRGLSFHI